MAETQDERGAKHSHGAAGLDAEACAILARGAAELLRMTDGMDFGPMPSGRYPWPLTQAVYAQMPRGQAIRADVQARVASDPVGALDYVLALLELCESNQPDIAEHVVDDPQLTRLCFSSKRANGWIAVVGDADRGRLESAINRRWQFRFFHGPARPTSVYPLLNALARYAYVYGRIAFGDFHELSHFVEDHTPGLLICRGRLADLELTVSLAAMKMGVPAIVAADYPFPLGRTLRVDGLDEIVEAVVAFPNIRRLLRTPGIPQMPDYCDREHRTEQIAPAVTWGRTAESFYIVRKGPVESPGFSVAGEAGEAMGVTVTIDAEPMDAFDCEYVERRIAEAPSMMKDVAAEYADEKLLVHQAAGADLDPRRIGEVLLAAVRHHFPRIKKVRVEVQFDREALAEIAPRVAAEKRRRRKAIDTATEESVQQFLLCVGCSPFAPDHVCVLTPQRLPQCGRPYGMIKTGALYAYDDMSNIHHSALHRQVNSHQIVAAGRCLDPLRGEWEGINRGVARLSGGRTTRVYLHSIDGTPHTGCGCFRLVMFRTDRPREGIGVMDSGYGGRAPDGRSWQDLHYSLAGKQTDGIAGAAPSYLGSPKFLLAHGGWDSVVWVSPRIAEIMGEKLPTHVAVGPP